MITLKFISENKQFIVYCLTVIFTFSTRFSNIDVRSVLGVCQKFV